MIICRYAREATTYSILNNFPRKFKILISSAHPHFEVEKWSGREHISSKKNQNYIVFIFHFSLKTAVAVSFHQLETSKTHQFSIKMIHFPMFSISCNLFSSETGGAEKVEIGGGALCHEGPYLVAIGTGLYGPGESGQICRDQEFDGLNLHGFFCCL